MAIARPAELLTTAGPAPLLVAVMTVAASMVLAVATLPIGRGGPTEPAPPVATPSATFAPDSTPTASPTPAPTATSSPTVTPAPTATPSPTVTPAPTASPAVATPRATPQPTPVPPAPPPPAGHGSLPTCAYADALTPHQGLGEWQVTLLDTIYQVPSTYAPGDLVDSSAAGLNAGYPVRSFLIEDLAAMAADARAAGSPIQLVSGYRSHAQQEATFDHWVSVGGYEQALRTSARPGHSEHQLGTAIDVTSEDGAAPWAYSDWASTAAGAWMATNASAYGFVMSYPRDASTLSCYSYEPWHYRYVGRELAAQVTASGAVLRQMIWELQ